LEGAHVWKQIQELRRIRQDCEIWHFSITGILGQGLRGCMRSSSAFAAIIFGKNKLEWWGAANKSQRWTAKQN